jgi:hypothetical protein
MLPGQAAAQAGDTWRWIPPNAVGLPTGKEHTAVWTGSEMLVWGGAPRTTSQFVATSAGGRYDPVSDAWTALPVAGAAAQRTMHTAHWTGREMLVWGGMTNISSALLGDGAGYDPVANVWRPMASLGAPSGRYLHTAVWTGSELIVWGGGLRDGPSLGDGARYNPTTDRWTPLPSAGAPTARVGHTAVWTGREMLVWGGSHIEGESSTRRVSYAADGARYNPATDTWRPMSTTGIPEPRESQIAVWTGAQVFAWGTDGPPGKPSAAGYDPDADRWTPLAAPPSDMPRLSAAVWTGTEAVVWAASGPCAAQRTDCPAVGARYNPSSDGWALLPASAAPWDGTSLVWTGREIIVCCFTTERYGRGPAEASRYYLPGAAVPPLASPPPVPHDERYFAQTGYRVEHDQIWALFTAIGGVDTFGFPVSRTFRLEECEVQLFQRHVAQSCGGGPAALLNLLDPEFFPYSPTGGTRINGSSFPAPDSALKMATPQVGTRDYAARLSDFIAQNVPDQFEGIQVNFLRTFDLSVWGVPISHPMRDPNNPDFIYQRFQRGIMHHVVSEASTRGVLLADYFKQVMRDSPDLPADLRQQAIGNRFFGQYCPNGPRSLCRELILTDLSFAFEPG